MHRGRISGGYTIVETMIFLAVSGFMFVIAAYFIQGKQASAQFYQSMNSINTQVQQVINDVSDNNYSSTQLSCSLSGLANQPLTIQTSSSTNYGCTYLGKIIQFSVNDDGTKYNVYAVAGCQYNPCSTTVNPANATVPTDFTTATPQVIDPGNGGICTQGGTSANPNNTYNLTSCNTLEWGLKATAMYYVNSAHVFTPTNSIGFFGSFAQSVGGGLSSGSQTIDVLNTGYNTSGSPIDITNPVSNVGEKGMVTDANSYLEGYTNVAGNSEPQTIPNPYFIVCFNDGHGHVGALTIGGGSSGSASGQRLTSSIQTSNTSIALAGSTQCT